MYTTMKLSTNLDVNVDTARRVAGVDRARLHNDWVDCPFEVRPASSGGYKWSAKFRAKDDGSARLLEGLGETRSLATQQALNQITRHISNIVGERNLQMVPLPARVSLTFIERIIRGLSSVRGWLVRRFGPRPHGSVSK
jgi:hypothetical protein